MKIIKQCGFLFFICLLGIYLSRLSPYPMPAGVLSMSILFCLLLSRWVDVSSLEETTDVLLGNMAFFFLPLSVGIIDHIEFLRGNILVLLTICFVATFVTFTASAFSVIAVIWLIRKLRKKALA
jgi:holin-like protein